MWLKDLSKKRLESGASPMATILEHEIDAERWGK